jgi:hypothetical protein
MLLSEVSTYLTVIIISLFEILSRYIYYSAFNSYHWRFIAKRKVFIGVKSREKETTMKTKT